MTYKNFIPAVIFLLFLAGMHPGIAQNDLKYSLGGTISDSQSGLPLPGARVTLKNLSMTAISDENGAFKFSLVPGDYVVISDYLGFSPRETLIALQSDTLVRIMMEPLDMALGEVEVVATGYQLIPKERSTGSFVSLDRELVNRRVSTNLIDRLEDITPGLVFNRTGPANDPLSIRGRSTIFANTQPLIILDNFPYDGPLENINPNDVETITVLRDAAAASIWGARAGNGVIVVTTKSGKAKSPQVSFNSNVTVSESPDLFYEPLMSVRDFIAVERLLFDRGIYNSQFTSVNRPPLSPVAETLFAQRNGLISEEEADRRIDAMGNKDVRKDIDRYYYRPPVIQQYALNISGGTGSHSYYLSGGYDATAESLVGNRQDRITLNMNNQWKLLQNKLDFKLGLNYVGRNSNQTTELPGFTYPFDQLADESGNPLPITQGYSERYIREVSGSGLLDWTFTPLEEIGKQDNRSGQDEFRVNLGSGYKLSPTLRAEINYQFWKNNRQNRRYYSPDLFYTRDLINLFTQRQTNGTLQRAIPEGGILDLRQTQSESHNLRFQLNYHKAWGGKHELTALGGYELRDLQSESNATRFYGYDDELGISRPVDRVSTFRYFHNGLIISIPNGDAHQGSIDRFLSYYANLGYSLMKKYHFSASARKDASNLFGVATNQRGVPLWSAGLGWTLSEESFYNWGLFPYAKLRLSYGYNGNIDNTLSSLTTAQYSTNFSFVIPAGELGGNIVNNANPLLRWEKIGITNLGLDLESKDSRIRVNLEAYLKKGEDLIGDAPYVPSTGVTRFRGNTANTETKGVDLDLQTVNIKGRITWQTNFLLSHVQEKVTNYFYKVTALTYLQQPQSQLLPLEGRPLFAIYSLPWGGLDPDTGDPRGILDGEPSRNYPAIFTSAAPENLIYHGPRRPTTFGALRNTLNWKGFSLSVNISYRLGYYYRRESVLYSTLLRGFHGHKDYTERWQQPGDELTTNVPSIPAVGNVQRDNIHRFSEILVEKGDHIRLQDIRFGYAWVSSNKPWIPLKNAELYGYANNLGILWKASKDPLDPDFRTQRPLISVAVGLRASF